MKCKSVVLMTAMFVLIATSEVGASLILTHNGTASSNPAGTGAVNVALNASFSAVDTLNLTKTFNQNAVLQINLTDNGQGGSPIRIRVNETVVNNTNEAWSDFHIQVSKEFSGTIDPNDPFNSGGAMTFSPMSLLGSAKVTILGQNPPFPQALDIYFSRPFNPGESFNVAYTALVTSSSPNNISLVITEFPTVPEPSTIVLIATGLPLGLGFWRYRRKRVVCTGLEKQAGQ